MPVLADELRFLIQYRTGWDSMHFHLMAHNGMFSTHSMLLKVPAKDKYINTVHTDQLHRIGTPCMASKPKLSLNRDW